MLCYDDVSVRSSFRSTVPYANLNANRNWETHYANSLILKFYILKGSTLEKMQASAELDVCNRKMKYWSQHPNFCIQAAAQTALKLKKDWQNAQ
jgi:hypothetical protein